MENIKDGWNTVGKAQVLYLKDEELKIKSLLEKIKTINPDIIYLNSLFLYNFLLASLKYKKIYNRRVKIILAPRGEICKNALKIKLMKKMFYINFLQLLNLKRYIYWHATSDEEKESIIKNFNVNKERISLVEVLPACIDVKEKIDIKKKKNQLRCVFISRICEKKNLLDAIKYVNNAEDGVTLDIYGFREDEKYWKKCEMEIRKSKKIKYCGILEPDEVPKKFNEYELFLFPTYSENYGHVIAESMLGGCPVLISDQTPWNDVKENNAGFVEKLHNDDEFISTLNRINKMEKREYEKLKSSMKSYILNKINYEKIVKKYKNMFEV